MVIGKRRCISRVDFSFIWLNESFRDEFAMMGIMATLMALAIRRVKGSSLAPYRKMAKVAGEKFLVTMMPSM